MPVVVRMQVWPTCGPRTRLVMRVNLLLRKVSEHFDLDQLLLAVPDYADLDPTYVARLLDVQHGRRRSCVLRLSAAN